jgi:hypothetical protein
VRAVWPPGRRLLTAQTMLSAVAGRLGLRNGVLVVDRMGGGGLTGPYQVAIGLIRTGSEEDTARDLTQLASDLGYELGRHPGMTWRYKGTARVCRFVRSDAMPDPEIATVAPGGSVYGVTVPEGATGVMANVGIGGTMTDGGRRDLNTLNPVTAARMADLGVNVVPPRSWQRFWCWWWIRTWRRRRLAWAAWRLGAYRGCVIASWFIGGEAVGPYSFSIATVRSGDSSHLLAQFAARARALGFSPGIGLAAAAEHRDVVPAGRTVVSVTTYAPGEKVTDSMDPPVQSGSTGVIVTVTGSAPR